MSSHRCVLAPHLKEALGTGAGGKYGRMFADLPALDVDDGALIGPGRSGALFDAGVTADREDGATDDPATLAGRRLFGQFIAHDITTDRSLPLHPHVESEIEPLIA